MPVISDGFPAETLGESRDSGGSIDTSGVSTDALSDNNNDELSTNGS